MEDTNPDNNPTAQEIQRLNRLLLQGAYLPYNYGVLNPATAQGMANYAGGSDPVLTGLLLLDFDALTSPANKAWWIEDGVQPLSLYTEHRFLGIPLRPDTSKAVLALTASTPPDQVIQLNRWLLEDASAASLGVLNFNAGALSAATAIGLNTYLATQNAANQAAVEPLLVADLNKVLTSGVYSRTSLEASYGALLTSYKTRGAYLLIDVPSETTWVAAKTAWNLRKRLARSGDVPQLSANFVNGEKVPGNENKQLLAGDINGDNAINLGDFSIFQPKYLTTDPIADLNGDGVVNIFDYSLLQVNFNATGDPAVNQP
jgi:hypothetical protein